MQSKKKIPRLIPRETAFELLQILLAVTYRWLVFLSEHHTQVWINPLLPEQEAPTGGCSPTRQRWASAVKIKGWVGGGGGCVDACLTENNSLTALCQKESHPSIGGEKLNEALHGETWEVCSIGGIQAPIQAPICHVVGGRSFIAADVGV